MISIPESSSDDSSDEIQSICRSGASGGWLLLLEAALLGGAGRAGGTSALTVGAATGEGNRHFSHLFHEPIVESKGEEFHLFRGIKNSVKLC